MVPVQKDSTGRKKGMNKILCKSGTVTELFI